MTASIERFKRLELAYDSRIVVNRYWYPAQSQPTVYLKVRLTGVVDVRYFYQQPKKWMTNKRAVPFKFSETVK
jgi:hypothetical protein